MKTRTIKCQFENSRGHTLDARLDLPAGVDTEDIQHFVTFSHCFTCSKETITTFRLSRQLAEAGYGVLRFDFTGLGDSEGEFASSTFSTTRDDLRCAIAFLQQEYKTPSFLMGHSMGGTTALSLAGEHDSVIGVVTVASPSEPDHVLHHFGQVLTQLEHGFAASFEVAGQYFDIEPGFIEDVRGYDMKQVLSELDKPVLVVNIENDALVDADNAEEIKAWTASDVEVVDVTGSDHLLSNRQASEFVAGKIVEWIKKQG